MSFTDYWQEPIVPLPNISTKGKLSNIIVFFLYIYKIKFINGIELDDINHFLTTPTGFEPFLRYLLFIHFLNNKIILLYFCLALTFYLFCRFLHAEFSAEIIFLWKDIEDYSKEPDPQERKTKYQIK